MPDTKPSIAKFPTTPSKNIPVTPVNEKFKPVVQISIDKANACVYLGPGSGIDTGRTFASFFGGNHTLSAWFMPQFEYAADGPLFASLDGSFVVGQGDYQLSNGWFTKPKVAGDPLLTVIVQGKRSIYLAPSWRHGTWHHVACVRDGQTLRLYLDGKELTPVTVNAAQGTDGKRTTTAAAKPTVPTGYVPAGTLLLGRCRESAKKANAQAYGLLDDVAVFSKALDSKAVGALVVGKRLNGYEDGLVAGWGLDVGKAKALLPPKLQGAVAQKDIPTWIKISTNRDNKADGALLDSPWVYGTSMPSISFPFPKGEIWYVMQPMNSPTGSHFGYAAFCLDLGHPDSDHRYEKHPAGTKFAPLEAGASGYVVRYTRDMVSTKSNNEPNMISTVNATGDVVTYLHLAADSMSDAVLKGDHTSTEPVTVWPGIKRSVKKHDTIAKIGPKAAHLHIAGSELYVDEQNPEGVESRNTTPFGFNDIEVKALGSSAWVKADSCYLPKVKDQIRRV